MGVVLKALSIIPSTVATPFRSRKTAKRFNSAGLFSCPLRSPRDLLARRKEGHEAGAKLELRQCKRRRVRVVSKAFENHDKSPQPLQTGVSDGCFEASRFRRHFSPPLNT